MYVTQIQHVDMAFVCVCVCAFAGIGFVSTTPTSTFEYIVTFLTAYLGGVLAINLMLINTVLGRRFWATAPEEEKMLIPSAPAPVQALLEKWSLNSVVAARA